MSNATKNIFFINRASRIDFSSGLESKLNEMDDPVWYIYDTANTDKKLPFSINWELMDEYDSKLFKGFLRWKYTKGEGGNGKIYANEKTVKNDVTNYNKFIASHKKLHDNRNISDLCLEEIKDIISHIAPAPYKFESFLRAIMAAYNEGFCFDGISLDLPLDLTRYLHRDRFKDEKEFKTWLKGGTWGNLPVSVAIVYLNDCIEILENKAVEFLLEYFRIQKSNNSVALEYLFSYGQQALVYDVIEEKPVIIKLSRNCRSGLRKMADLFTKYGYSSKNKLTKNFLRKTSVELHNAALISCLMLTGIRLSELSSIRAKDLKSDGKGTYSFTSKIDKTHSGMRVVRSISGVAYEAMRILIGISYRDNVEDAIFSHTYTSGYLEIIDKDNAVSIRSETLGKKVSQCYSEWRSIQSSALKEYSPLTTSAHAMRHIFAAVALRRFDGRVSERIRRHYGHAFKSRYIRAYVDTKYDQDYQYAAEREYINEIITGISEGDKSFYGPVAMQIKRRISEDHRFLSLEEFNDALEDLSGEFENIVPHEFGYCVPRTREIAHAQCKDKDTGEARIWEQSSVKNCTKCVHRLTHISQAESVVRIAISHQNFIDQSPLKATSEISQKIVKQCEAVLSEMNYPMREANEC